MTKDLIDQFIRNAGGLDFPNAAFRGEAQASFTTPFGIDTSTDELTAIRVHLGTDRGHGSLGQVFAPFDGAFHIELSEDYGTLFRLLVAQDFEIRIGHMKFSNIAVRNRSSASVKAGELLGLAGSEGKSTGIHTHTEVVSVHGESEICEEILRQKGLSSPWFSPEELQEKAGSLWPQLRADMLNKGVLRISPLKIQKSDRWTGKVQIYYDSRVLFRI